MACDYSSPSLRDARAPHRSARCVSHGPGFSNAHVPTELCPCASGCAGAGPGRGPGGHGAAPGVCVADGQPGQGGPRGHFMTHPVSGCGASQTEDRRSPRARGQRKRRPRRPSTGFSHGRDPRWRPRPQEAGPPAVSLQPPRGALARAGRCPCVSSSRPCRPRPRSRREAVVSRAVPPRRAGRFGLGPWFPGFGSRPAPAWARCSAGCCRRCGEGGAVGGRWVLGAGGPRPRSLARGSPRLRAGPGPGPHRACVRRAATRRARVLRDRSEGGSRHPRSRGLRREVPGGGERVR